MENDEKKIKIILNDAKKRRKEEVSKARMTEQKKNSDVLKINNVLREIRVSKNITQLEMATKLGVSQNGYGKIERGQTFLTLPKIKEIAKALDVNYAELLSQVEGFEQEKTEFETVKLNEEIEQVEAKHLEKLKELLAQHSKEVDFLKGTIQQKDTIISLLEQRIDDLNEKIRIIMFAKGNTLGEIIEMIDIYNKVPKDK